MDSYTSKFATMVDDALKMYEEKFPRERFVFRNREDIPTSTICNSVSTNLAEGSNDLNWKKWSTYFQLQLQECEARYASTICNFIKVIPVTNGDDLNDIDTTRGINTLDCIDTSINSKTLDDIESSNHINDLNDNEWDFMNEELGELGLEDKNPKSNEQVKL